MLRSLDGARALANTKPVRARDYSVEIQRSGPARLPPLYHNFHTITIPLADDLLVVRTDHSGTRAARLVAGEVLVQPAGQGSEIVWPDGAHCMYVHLHPRWIRRLGERIWGTRGTELEAQPCLRDPTLTDIGRVIHSFVGFGTVGLSRQVDELVAALAHHVVRRYPAAARPIAHVGSLSIEQILDAFRDESPSWEGMAALAARCGLTRSHFSRRMVVIAGVSPYAMVVGSRIEAAKNLLQRGDLSLSAVAYAAGFADQSHFTRAFARAAGMTPARFRARLATPA